MKLQEVIDNLRHTIEGKKLFAMMVMTNQPETANCQHIADVVLPMIRMNVEELEKIRNDLIKVRDAA